MNYFVDGFISSDLILGASLYLPPFLKPAVLGLLIWLCLHHLLEPIMYSGKVWHPSLMDLSLLILSVAFALFLVGG